MKTPDRTEGKRVSRRDLLRAAGIAGGAAVVVPGAGLRAQGEEPAILTAEEYATLDAICARIIPADENGPGAGEARAARYIDRGLGGALSGSLAAYREGLAALDAYARGSRGEGFRNLTEADQDRVLAEVEDGDATGFAANPAQFFNLVRGHTIQGTFSDPFYGGNDNFTGWDMIGYPGVRTAVPAAYQQMDGDHAPNHVSVYDFTMFDEGEI